MQDTILSTILVNPHNTIISILQMKKLKHRETKVKSDS